MVLSGVLSPALALETGANWYDATGAAPFAERYWHTSVVFDGRMWVIGGASPSDYFNDTWSSSNGAAWTVENASPGFLARGLHGSSVFLGRMWVTGGAGSDGNGAPIIYNDVWSSADGAIWEEANPAALPSGRFGHSSANFTGRLWIIGGNDGAGTLFNDAWNSTDGVTWETASAAAAFPARYGHASLVFGDRLWVIGGTDGMTYYNDVWNSTDGISWEAANLSAEFSGRYGHSAVVHDGRMWVIGGTDDASILNDTWYSTDGIAWYRATGSADFPGRCFHSSVPYNGEMWVIGGEDLVQSLPFNDAWYSPPTAALDATGITPASGVNSSTVSITSLTGTGFVKGATVKLARAGRADITATGVNVVSPTRMTCNFPITDAEWGDWDVVVTNPGGETDLLAGGFAVKARAPVVTSISPERGYNTGSIFINNLVGDHFLAGATVRLVNASAGPAISATNVSISTDGKIINCTFNLVGASWAKRNVTVTNADGMAGTLANGFLVEPRFPVVNNMIPNTSENTGVVNVTITGTDFVTGALVRLEKSGQTPINATNISVNSETNITCSFDLSAVADGSWTLNVINPGNQGNNIFQFIIYAAKSTTTTSASTAVYRGGSGGSTGGTTVSGASMVASQPAASQPDAQAAVDTTSEGVVAELSVTSKGVVTRETSLASTDNLATVSIPAGITATDATGSALASVSITPLAPASVPAGTAGTGPGFTGMAYDLGPDGATFSPAITLSFAVPDATAGQDYTVMMLDEATGRWMDVPTTFHPESGTVTAEISHFCCFALFARVPVTPAAKAAIPAGTVTPKPATTPPPTAMSIFSGLMIWTGTNAVKYPFLAAASIILILAILWFGRRQYRIYRITRRRKNP